MSPLAIGGSLDRFFDLFVVSRNLVLDDETEGAAVEELN